MDNIYLKYEFIIQYRGRWTESSSDYNLDEVMPVPTSTVPC